MWRDELFEKIVHGVIFVTVIDVINFNYVKKCAIQNYIWHMQTFF